MSADKRLDQDHGDHKSGDERPGPGKSENKCLGGDRAANDNVDGKAWPLFAVSRWLERLVTGCRCRSLV